MLTENLCFMGTTKELELEIMDLGNLGNTAFALNSFQIESIFSKTSTAIKKKASRIGGTPDSVTKPHDNFVTENRFKEHRSNIRRYSIHVTLPFALELAP